MSMNETLDTSFSLELLHAVKYYFNYHWYQCPRRIPIVNDFSKNLHPRWMTGCRLMVRVMIICSAVWSTVEIGRQKGKSFFHLGPPLGVLTISHSIHPFYSLLESIPLPPDGETKVLFDNQYRRVHQHTQMFTSNNCKKMIWISNLNF